MGKFQDATAAAGHSRPLAIAVPVILAVVALTQMVLATTTELTPWRGGGFGMFSTLDAHSTRHLVIEVTTADGRRLPVDTGSVLLVEGVRTAFVNHRAWPRQRTLDAYAAALTAADLSVVDGVVTVPREAGQREGSERDTPDIEEVHIAVWTSRFHLDDGRLEPVLLHRGSTLP